MCVCVCVCVRACIMCPLPYQMLIMDVEEDCIVHSMHRCVAVDKVVHIHHPFEQQLLQKRFEGTHAA